VAATTPRMRMIMTIHVYGHVVRHTGHAEDGRVLDDVHLRSFAREAEAAPRARTAARRARRRDQPGGTSRSRSGRRPPPRCPRAAAPRRPSMSTRRVGARRLYRDARRATRSRPARGRRRRGFRSRPCGLRTRRRRKPGPRRGAPRSIVTRIVKLLMIVECTLRRFGRTERITKAAAIRIQTS
jgi:hypothetical protein